MCLFYSVPAAGGVCRDRVNGYHCECSHGHAGRNCDLALDPCLGFKCFNHGTCITVGAGFTPSCLCRPEFSGQRCETPLDPCVGIACLHGGTCLRTGSASFHCACANGYTGSVCQIPPPSLVCRDQPCLNGGTCVRTVQSEVMMCVCLPGFQGALCERREWTTVSAELVTWDSGGETEEEEREEEEEEEGVLDEEWARGRGRGGGREVAGGGAGEVPRNYQVPPNASVTVRGPCRKLQCLTLVLTVLLCAVRCFHYGQCWETT